MGSFKASAVKQDKICEGFTNLHVKILSLLFWWKHCIFCLKKTFIL